MRHHSLTLLLPKVIEVTRGLDLNHNPSPRQPGSNTPRPCPQISPMDSSAMWPTSYVSSVSSWTTFLAIVPIVAPIMMPA
ncbi:hypothetical protein DSO57_1031635 [Entomophthora muscae]|uniref:Uncharacterized protein n=1 Tax=Entomophthora muscae TaxID=34485 RepID=A0ACC2UL74_9FUNG|nr:hypothetical protein DSO57_1031635 [Entomophthora muscae]